MKKVLFALALLGTLTASAQIKDDKNVFNHLSVGAGVGTNGISVEVGTTVLPFITMRGGVDIMPKFSYATTLDVDKPSDWSSLAPIVKKAYLPNEDMSSNVEKVDLEGSMNSVSGKLLFDIYTGKNSMFHFTVGAFFGGKKIVDLKARGNILAALESYNQDVENGIPGVGTEKFTSEGYEIGVNKGRSRFVAETAPVKPYIGFGVGRTVPRKRVGCKFEMGALIWGKPKIKDYYKGNYVHKNDFEQGSDMADVFKVTDKISVYPVLKCTVFGRIF